MRQVMIEYPLFLRGKKVLHINVPEKWEDLNGSQFAICARVIYEHMEDEDFICAFFGIEKKIVKKISRFVQYKLIEMAEFVSSPKGISNTFYMDRIPDTNLFSPGAKLKGVTFEHFMFIDTFFFDYINNPSIELLQKFVAAVYMEKEELITTIDRDKRIKYISKNVDDATLYAIFLNYTFIRKWLSKTFPHLFSYSESEEKSVAPKQKVNNPDWISILDALVSDDILNYDDYKDIPCTRAFKVINRRISSYYKNGK